MQALIQKVLNEMRMMKKDKCRHSDGTHTVIAYKALNRTNDVAFIRIDVYSTADLKKNTTRESQQQDDS